MKRNSYKVLALLTIQLIAHGINSQINDDMSWIADSNIFGDFRKNQIFDKNEKEKIITKDVSKTPIFFNKEQVEEESNILFPDVDGFSGFDPNDLTELFNRMRSLKDPSMALKGIDMDKKVIHEKDVHKDITTKDYNDDKKDDKNNKKIISYKESDSKEYNKLKKVQNTDISAQILLKLIDNENKKYDENHKHNIRDLDKNKINSKINMNTDIEHEKKQQVDFSLAKILSSVSKDIGKNINNKDWQYKLTDIDNNGKKEMSLFYAGNKNKQFDEKNWRNNFEQVKQIPLWNHPLILEKLTKELNELKAKDTVDNVKGDNKETKRSADDKNYGNIIRIGDMH